MGVAVLQPQDCLSRHPHHHHHHHHHRHLISPATKPRRTPNPNPSINRSSRRRRNSPPPPSSTKPQAQAQAQAQPRSKSPPVMSQIRILKRGEDLSQGPPTKQEVVSRPLLVPEPTRSKNGQIPDGFYAGSAFVTSPPPSSLPLPAFFTKRNCGLGEAHNQEIASQLRRVLKLNE